MNHDLHRVIYNPTRGSWVAVQETAAARRGCAAGSTPPLASPGLKPLAAALALLLAAPLAVAQIIADPAAPGRERPTVLNSANGTPTVNIQTPSAAGVSRNRYQQFDIGQQGERGAILNNSRTGAHTQIGGAVAGNPWLARGSAKVIVNEVRSAAQSRLGGALEVAGQRADVIIANPAGLVVNGMTMINAAGVTLTTGAPRYGADGSLDGYSVRGGAIQLEGRGLDATQANYTQVLARAVTLNAGLWAQDLRVVTGVNELAADGRLQSSAAGNGNEKPQFALDVAQLGGMYAHKITLIGTEAGLGVRNAGQLAAASGPLVLSADGQLSNSGAIATQGSSADLEITAKGLDNSGTLTSQRDTVLSDGGTTTVNTGTIEAHRQLIAQAGELNNRAVGKLSAARLNVTAARLDNAGQITQTGPQVLDISSQIVTNTGENAMLGAPVPAAAPPSTTAATDGKAQPLPTETSALAPAPAKVPDPTPDPAPATLALPRGSIHVAHRLTNTGQLLANGATDVKAIQSFVNSAAANLGTLHTEGLLDNRRGVLQLQRLTGAQTSVLNTAGSLTVAHDLRLMAHRIDNTGGFLGSAQSLSAQASTLTSDAASTLNALGDLSLELSAPLTHQGTMATDGKLLVKSTGALINQGKLLGGTGTELDATEVEIQPDAEVSAHQTTTVIRAPQGITNRGLIDGADTRLDADNVNNLGTGRIYGDHVSIAAHTLENRPEPGVDRTPVIASRGDLDLGVGKVINVHGAKLSSLGDTRMGARLDADRRATGRAQMLDNTAGLIDVQGNLKLDVGVVDNLNAGLKIEPLAEVEKKAVADQISLPGRPPESAHLYREVGARQFVPYFERKGHRMYPEMGILGQVSDGRIFKPAYPDIFPRIPQAAFIDPATSLKDGDRLPEGTPLYLEPAGSPRFAKYKVEVPKNYTATVPDPTHYGALRQESGEPGWRRRADLQAYEAAMAAYRQSIVVAQQLHEAILKTVKEDNRVLADSRGYTKITQATQTIHRDKVTETHPGRIEVGGNINFDGLFNNIDSVVTAGNRIDGKNAKPNNQATDGNQTILTEGKGTRYHWEHRGRRDRQERKQSREADYSHVGLGSFKLPTLVFAENHARAPITQVEANSNTGHHATDSGRLARTLEAAVVVPQSSQYVINPAGSPRPLVETDPAFLRGQQWASSDQLLQAFDASLLQKRLGDGFYEQQLIQQQVGQLTGRRFLGDYRSNDAQYQALLQSGTTFAKAHGLRPGVALSAAQMAKLTSDMVWLVEQNVTLPDGSVQTVLAPRLYVLARPGDLNVQGALISADSIDIDTDKNVDSSGMIAGRRLVKIKAHDINNIAGNIAGQLVGLRATRDINVEGGTISATEALLAHADRDINAASTTRSALDGRNINVDQVAGFVLLQDPTRNAHAVSVASLPSEGESAPSGLHLSSGRDINLQAVKILNQVEGSQTSIDAKRDVHLSTADTRHDARLVWDPKNHLLLSGSREIGSEILTQGPTSITAGQDISARAAQVQSAGHLDVHALEGSVDIAAGQTGKALDETSFTQRSGFLSSSSHSAAYQSQAAEALPSDFSGKTVHIDAGKDIAITGSNVTSDQDTWLSAKRNISLLQAPETSSQHSAHSSRSSGLFGSGWGITLGSQRQRSEQQAQHAGSAPSTVGSLHGPVRIEAGNHYRQSGSNTWANEGDLFVTAKKIEITGAPETGQGSAHSRFKQSGLSLSLSSPVIGLAQTATSLADAASNTSSTRMQALAAGAAVLNVHAQRKALQAIASGKVQDMGLGANLSLGSSSSRSDSAYSLHAIRQSQVLAGGNVSLLATGAGEQSDLVLDDVNVHGGKLTTLLADHKIFMRATPQTRSETSSNSSRSAGIGLSLSGAGPAIGASASRGAGQSHSEERIHHKTLISGGKGLILYSGSDTEMRGAIINAPWVGGGIGGNLIIESLQDTSRFDGRQSHAGGAIAVGPGLVSGGASYSGSRATGDFASVSQPSGIYAGDGGYDLTVKGNTAFKGGVIASTQAAIDNDRNRLKTGTMTYGDIENYSHFNSSGIHLSGGYTSLHPAMGKSGGGAAAGVSQDSGRIHSTTQSSISPGTIIITNEAAQQALTGQTAAEAVAGINRDIRTEAKPQGLSKNWDGPRMLKEREAESYIAAMFGQQASQAIGNYAKQQMEIAKDLRQQAQQDPTRAVELTTQAQEIEKNWGSEGVRRVAAHGVVGGLTGGLPGFVGAVSGTVTAPIVADELRKNDIPEPLVDALTALASTVSGGVTGKAEGASAAFHEVANNFLPHIERELMNKSIKSCYTEGNLSACDTAATLKRKDQLSDQLLTNAIATCNGSDCNEVSNYIKSQLHGLDCLIPNICKDSNKLQNYWIIAQEKSQGDMKDYPESWLLDAKAIIDLGHYGVKILSPKGHIIGSNESLLALKKLTTSKTYPLTGTRADIYTSSSISKSELGIFFDDAMQYTQYQNSKNWIYPKNLGFFGEITKKTLPIGTKVDRLGSPFGSYLAPAGTAYEARALPPGSGAEKFYSYEVAKPLPVIEGKVAPAFGQEGGGLQMLPDLGFRANIQWLIDNDYLRIVK